MRVVFMGTPLFAVAPLMELAEHHDVVLAVTRPDAVRKRGRTLEPSEVKKTAQTLGIPVYETKRVTPELMDKIRELKPHVICVAAYGALLPQDLLDVATYGCVNVHASPLPHGRGAAPIQHAILDGERFAGVSIMRVELQLDAGPWCRQAMVPVGEKTCLELMSELSELGARELITALDDMQNGSVVWVEQDPREVTYAGKIDKRDLYLNPSDTAFKNKCRVQASLPSAPARVKVLNKDISVQKANVVSYDDAVFGAPDASLMLPGKLINKDKRVFLCCSDAALELLRVKPAGKQEMDASAWVRGLHLKANEGCVWTKVEG